MNAVVIRETVRRHVTSVAFVVFTVLTACVAAASAWFAGTASAWQGLIGLLTLITGSQLIAPEFSSGTLQLILAKPVNRASYLLSRVAGVTLSVWLALAVCGVVDLVARLARGGGFGERLYAGTLNRGLVVLLACSLLALLGSFLRSYLHIALYLLLDIGLAMAAGLASMLANGRGFGGLGDFFAKHEGIVIGLHRISDNLFPDAPLGVFDRTWTLMVASNAAIALLAACLFFRNREVPYGAD